MRRHIENAVAALTTAGCIYASGVFCASWFPCGWTLGDLFDWVR